jgi:hypothetical protein
MSYIDFFPYYSNWTVHHQVDWLIAKRIAARGDGYLPRFYSCSHHGCLPCATSRGFKPGTTESEQICNSCQMQYINYFSMFLQAERLTERIQTEIDLLNVAQIKTLAHQASTRSDLSDALDLFFESIDELSELTALTHFRISKTDLREINASIATFFTRTIALEAVNIAHNWSISMPTSVVVFNGRLAPYIAPYYLAKTLGIPVYVHERGAKKDYSVYFNEYPSTGLCALSVLQRMNSLGSGSSDISDKLLKDSLYNRFNGLGAPSNYPDLFDSSQKFISADAQCEKHDVLFIISSEDEADSFQDADLATAQRNAIESLVFIAGHCPDLSFAIKSHPHIYGSKGYPGMPYSAQFVDKIEEVCSSLSNITVFGRAANEVNPFSLVLNAKIVMGLHSSLLEFAWFHGRRVLTHLATDANGYATNVINFNSRQHIWSSLKKLRTNSDGNCSFSLLQERNSFIYMVIKFLAFDISLGNEVSIASDHFSPNRSIQYLESLNNSCDFEDLDILVDSIIQNLDINLELFRDRLGNVY